jgi:hypothetical protein
MTVGTLPTTIHDAPTTWQYRNIEITMKQQTEQAADIAKMQESQTGLKTYETPAVETHAWLEHVQYWHTVSLPGHGIL